MIYISIAISLLGSMLIIIIFIRLFSINHIYRSKYFKTSKEGVSDLVQYECVLEPGIILLKNGSLLSSFQYTGTDLSVLSSIDLNNMTSRISKAIQELGTGWTLNFDCIRTTSRNYPDRKLSYFSKEVSYAIDGERRLLFNSRDTMYNTTNVISLTYSPPNVLQTKFLDMMYDDNTIHNGIKTIKEKNLEFFKSNIANFLSILTTVLNVEQLKTSSYMVENKKEIYDTLLEYLHYCITGKAHPIRLPEDPLSLDLVIGGEDLFFGVIPKIGDKYIAAIAIDGFPAESYPTILAALADQPLESRFSTRFICIDNYEAETKLRKIQSKWSQMQRGIMTIIMNQEQTNANTNHDAVNMTNEAISGVTLQKNGGASFGYYTANVILMESDSDKLKHYSLEIKKIISSMGFNARIEGINAVEAYLGSLPGHVIENVRRFFLHTLNVGDLIPKHTIWAGNEDTPCDKFDNDAPALMECITDGNTPYHFNLHVADVGHTLIVGPTGAGKSTLLATIAVQAFRYKNATVFAFDKGMSIFTLNQALGGQHYELGGTDSGLSFAPFNYLETIEDRQWLTGYVERILELNGIAVDTSISNTIMTALTTLANEKQANPQVKHSITDFISQLHHSGVNIQEVLSIYDVSGAYGGYISDTDDNCDFAVFTTFEIEKLMNLNEKIMLPVIDYIFRKIDLSLKGQPSFVFFDEAWIAFKHPIFSRQLIEWLKVFRKRNCSVILATQNLNDMKASEALMTELIMSTSSKIFLPNASAMKQEFKNIYIKFGLNDEQIHLISEAIPKKHYYHYTNEGARMFELGLGKLALSFVAVSATPEIQKIKSYINDKGDDWYRYYLNDKGISIDDYLNEFQRSM